MTPDDSAYTWLRSYIARYGYPPSVREFGRGIGRGSTAAHYRLRRFEAMGWLKRERGKTRAMRLMRDD